jgi:hypothetical protein
MSAAFCASLRSVMCLLCSFPKLLGSNRLISNPKSESQIGLASLAVSAQAVQSKISDFGFKMQASSNFKMSPRLKTGLVKYIDALSEEGWWGNKMLDVDPPPRLRGLRWLRDILLTAQPPLLGEEGKIYRATSHVGRNAASRPMQISLVASCFCSMLWSTSFQGRTTP